MPNQNTIADVINRQNNGQPIVVTTASPLHQSFQLGQSPAVLTIPNPFASVNAPNLYPNLTADGRPFRVRAMGKVLGGEQYQIDLVSGLGLTPVVCSTGLSPGGLSADNWGLEATLFWDSASLLLRGWFEGWRGPVTVAQQSILANVSVANLNLLQFNVALTIATANASASVSLTEFSADYV